MRDPVTLVRRPREALSSSDHRTLRQPPDPGWSLGYDWYFSISSVIRDAASSSVDCTSAPERMSLKAAPKMSLYSRYPGVWALGSGFVTDSSAAICSHDSGSSANRGSVAYLAMSDCWAGKSRLPSFHHSSAPEPVVS